jgi:hypothetical protein
VIVIENCREQNFNQRKENEQRANEKENVETAHVWEPWQMRVPGEAIND